jgi:hypothetical protein
MRKERTKTNLDFPQKSNFRQYQVYVLSNGVFRQIKIGMELFDALIRLQPSICKKDMNWLGNLGVNPTLFEWSCLKPNPHCLNHLCIGPKDRAKLLLL